MKKTVEELKKLYPDIKWETAEPANEVEENFGTGTILAGTKHGETKTFFIPEKDNKKIMWGHVIANHLNSGADDEREDNSPVRG